MLVSGTKKDTIYEALDYVNEIYENNIYINDFKRYSDKRFRFTLRCKSSRGAGARLSWSGRYTVSACWHVHGYFFDFLFELDKNTNIYVGRLGWIKNQGDNWQDFNVGSLMFPAYISELCNCGDDEFSKYQDILAKIGGKK